MHVTAANRLQVADRYIMTAHGGEDLRPVTVSTWHCPRWCWSTVEWRMDRDGAQVAKGRVGAARGCWWLTWSRAQVVV
ncbi:MAG: hypothetical protein LC775_10220 [Acidobacteria bacterium]|nr:hypothetical protein [Acidobacteriota bacterium]